MGIIFVAAKETHINSSLHCANFHWKHNSKTEYMHNCTAFKKEASLILETNKNKGLASLC